MGAKVKINLGATPADESVDFFVVWNSSGRKLYVLAKDLANAVQIAHASNHIHYMDVGYSKDVLASKLNWRNLSDFKPYRRQLEVAIARRLQGTLHLVDGGLAVGDEEIKL
jgi:hypothetical protein